MISYTKDKDLLVLKASAGSGKTYNLVLFYLKYAFEHRDPEYFKRILAVTFTNKAANEMKNRILDALYRLQLDQNHEHFHVTYAENLEKDTGLALSEIQNQAQKVLHHILHNYSDFAVMTIDKFVHRLIRSFSKELDINMDFEVEMDTQRVLQSVADELISKVGEGNTELSAFILNMVQDALEEGKTWKHSEQLSTIARLLVDDEYINEVKAVTQYKLADYQNLLESLNDIVISFESELLRLSETFNQTLANSGVEPLDMAYGKTGFGGRIIKYVSGDFSDTKLPKRFFNGIDKGQWFSGSNKAHEEESLNQELTAIAHQFLKLEEQYNTRYQIAKLIKSNLYWVALLSEMKTILERMKEENNFLLISEFNQKATALILEESVPFIYEKLGERYNHFLIDEFQDTSELQFRNFLPLIDNALAKGNHNLIVGDGKQSIYRFRGGKVEQFNALPNVLNKEQNEKIEHFDTIFEGRGEALPIKENWRSRATIVNFNTDLYTRIKSLDEFSQSKNIIPEVFKDVHQNPQVQKEGYVCYEHKRWAEKYEAHNWYLSKTLETINDIVRKEERPFHYRDIAILVAKREQGNAIASHLSEHGIPVISDESLVVLSDYQVQLLWSLNQYAVQPKNNNFKKEVLIRYARINGASAHQLLRDYLKEDKQVDIQQFFKDIAFDFHAAHWAASSVYLRNIYWLEQLDIGFTENAYVERFIEEIFQYEQYNGPSISGFVKHFRENKDKVSISTPEGENAVQIMTIHKSKGLEFSVVILPFLDWILDNPRDVVMHFIDIKQFNFDAPIEKAYIKLSQKILEENNTWRDFYDEEKMNQKLDLLNRLYVATTRAIDEMYIFSSQLERSDKPGQNTSKRISDWLLQTFDADSKTDAFEVHFGTQIKGDKSEMSVEKQDDFVPFNGRIPQDVSYVSQFYEDIESDPDMWRKKGKMMHKVLEHITDKETWEEQYQYCVSKGWVDDTLNLKPIIRKFMEIPALNHFFDGHHNWLEQEVIDEAGRSFRIDRLWSDDEEIHILDFKLGKKGKRHSQYEKQVGQYIQLVSELSSKRVKGFVAYSSGEVTEVTQGTLF